MVNFGSKKPHPRRSVITVPIEETIRQENLRLALLRVESGNGTESDRRLVKDAQKRGTDLDSLREQKVMGEVSSYAQADGRSKNSHNHNGRDSQYGKEIDRGNVPFEGRAVPFRILPRNEVVAEAHNPQMNEAAHSGLEPIIEEQSQVEIEIPFVDAMEELAGVWREINGRASGEQVLFDALTNDELVQEASADGVKVEQPEAGDGLLLNFSRPQWRGKPKRDIFAVPKDSAIIDPWNYGRGNEAVFRIPRLGGTPHDLAENRTMPSNGVEHSVFVITEDELMSPSSELNLGSVQGGESVDLLEYGQPAVFVTPQSEGRRFAGTHRHGRSREPRPHELVPPFDGGRIAGTLNARRVESTLHSGEIARRKGELR